MTGSVQRPLRRRGKGRWKPCSSWTFLPLCPWPQLTGSLFPPLRVGSAS